MTPLGLVRRGLIHHAAGHGAAAAAVAVATAVIVAALIIGDSTTTTLRERALARLGRCTHLLAPVHPLRASEALLLAAPADLAVPLVALTGSVRLGDDGAAVPEVDVVGTDDRIWDLFPGSPRGTLAGRAAIIDTSLAGELKAKAGDELLVTVRRERATPGGTLFAHHKRNRITATLRLDIAAVLPAGSAVGFAPWPRTGQGPRHGILVDRAFLAAQAGLGDQVTQVALVRGSDDRASVPPTPAALGLRIVPDAAKGIVRIESADLLFTDGQEQAVRAAVREAGTHCAASSIYLADRVRCGERNASYAIIAGSEPLLPFTADDGRALTQPPGNGEAWINAWLAEDCGARTGSGLVASCPVPAGDGSYPLVDLALRTAAVLPLAGPAADRSLVPAIDGITEAEDLAKWDVPFPIDLARVTARDDEYWDLHRTTPRLFAAPAVLRDLWMKAGGHGRWITGLRCLPPAGMTVDACAAALAGALPRHADRTAAGFAARPVRDEAIAGAAGSTDLAQLFLGLGGILIIAAAVLAALTMRLLVDARARELGLLAACGFTAGHIRRLLLAEGLLVAAVGAACGAGLGIAFARLLLHLLGGAWAAAVGGLAPDLALTPGAIAIGMAAGLAIGAAALWWALRGMQRHDAAALIAAGPALATRQPAMGDTSALWINTVAMLWITVLMGLAFFAIVPWSAACLGTGTALLVAFFANLWRAAAILGRPDGSPPSWPRLVLRSIALHPLRSLAVTVLMATAVFLLVVVAVQRRDAGDEPRGTGGYRLAIETPLPLGYDLAAPGGRAKLGFDRADEAFFADTVLIPLLVAPGDDVSCRDPAAPQRPRILGIPPLITARDGFLTITADGSGWKALEAAGGDAIPVYGDADSVRWILHRGLGDVIAYPQDGGGLRLRIAGLLTGSIFAGELLMAETRFRTLFPRHDVPGRWLVACPPDRTGLLADILRRRLGPLGATVTPTRDIIGSVLAVQNTYLSVFLALGGLGLALAAAGMAALLVRTALERRWEWALLAATGIGRGRRAALLAVEHLLLVAVGCANGLLAAVVASAPVLAAPGTVPAWDAVALVLGLILAAAVVAAATVAWFATDAHPAEALRRI